MRDIAAKNIVGTDDERVLYDLDSNNTVWKELASSLVAASVAVDVMVARLRISFAVVFVFGLNFSFVFTAAAMWMLVRWLSCAIAQRDEFISTSLFPEVSSSSCKKSFALDRQSCRAMMRLFEFDARVDST